MALSWLFLVFSSVLFSSVFGAEEKPDIYDQAAVCPHRFHMGCMLDVVEKSCTGLQAVEACATKGKCNMDELNRIVGALDPSNFEALGKCCCTKAFKEGGYEDCKNPDPVCKKAIADHVEKDLKNHLSAMKKCLKKPKKATCKEALDSVKWASAAIQKARGEMWSTEGCKILAPSEPVSACGWNVKPGPRAIERADLYCDTIIWQFKEMGASDPFMSQCKDAPKMPEGGEVDEDGEPLEEEEEEEEEEGLGDGEEVTGKQGGENVEEKGDDLYSRASKCPHRRHMGCFLDIIEVSCEATRDLNDCARGKNCKKMDEIESFLNTLKPKSNQSVTTCCCSTGMPFEPCKKMDKICDLNLNKYKPDDFEGNVKIIKAYKKKPNKANAKKAIKAVKEIRDCLQKARGELWKVNGCEILAPMEPLVECGERVGDVRPIEREDLACEAMMWQYKEIRVYDPAMHRCPNAPKVNPEDIPKEGQSDEQQEETASRDEL